MQIDAAQATCNVHVAWIRKLRQELCPCNAGSRPIIVAAEKGHVAVVEALLENGASVHGSDKEGNGPCHYAVKNGDLDMIKMLAKLGCSLGDDSDWKASCLVIASTSTPETKLLNCRKVKILRNCAAQAC